MALNIHLIGLVYVFIFCSSFTDCSKHKYRICIVDGRGGFRKSTKYCPILDNPDSKVECILGLDRLDCLRKISKGTADFSIFTPEDLVTASNSQAEVLVTNELRFTKDPYEYEVVAVISNTAGITNLYDLRDKKLCHPGYGYEVDWTRIIANYLEISTVPQTCTSSLTLVENRIRASSQYFKSACKAGPWVNEPNLDSQLKAKYANLCELCGSPSICSSEDKYWGRRGPLYCLTDGAGDISWVRLDDVKSHFGITPGAAVSSPHDYSFLCQNGSTIPLNSTVPCVWVVKPWPVIGSRRVAAQEIQQFISTLTHTDSSSWQSALLNLIETYHLTIESLEPIEAIESYLDRAPGYLSANSYPGCNPRRTVSICTTSNLENAKCGWLREAIAVYGVEPDIECLKSDSKMDCLKAVQDKICDIVIVPADLTYIAKKDYNLKTLFYETVKDEDKYVTIAVTRADSTISSMKDLEGKKACFPSYKGIAWNSVLYLLREKNLFSSCSPLKEMENFFGNSCVPKLNRSQTLTSLCNKGNFDGEYGAMMCLTQGIGDVAFVSRKTFKNYFQDTKGGLEKEKNYKILCFEDVKPCHFSWSPPGQAMVRNTSSSLWTKDTLDLFLQMDNLVGKFYKSITTPFTMFGLFDGKSDVLFHDSTIRLRDVPNARNTDNMIRNYGEILEKIDNCTVPKSGQSRIEATNMILVLLFVIYVITNS